MSKSLLVSLFPATLITFMLDYGSTEKTFTVEVSGREVVVTGLDGIAMYVNEYGLADYVASVLSTFVVILTLLTLLVIVETIFKEKRKINGVER
jgi:hypothetical protein